MSVPIVIPQIFYDLIARVLPGYLFLYILGASIYDDVFWIKQLDIGQANYVFVFFFVVGYFIVCYFAGWVLRTISCFFGSVMLKFPVLRKYSINSIDDLMELEKKKSPTINDKYQMIRIKDQTSGFRIVKLRAEARMLEASRNGMIVIIMILISRFIVHMIVSYDLNMQVFAMEVLILSILAAVFQRALSSAFYNYIRNIDIIYKIIFENKKLPEIKNVPTYEIGNEEKA